MVKFEDKLKNHEYDLIWQEYCGFLDLDMDSYMSIQNRLMQEQLLLWKESELGKQILKGKNPQTIEEFRNMVPLTTYEDYAEVLLMKKGDMLPDEPIIWIETTWEGGRHPVKVAPYTRGMLDIYTNNVLACMILCTSLEKGKFDVRITDTILYGLAPLPYATGLVPLALQDQIGIEFLPPVKDAVKMSFSERNKKGFKMGLSKGIDYFFGVGPVAYYISLSLNALGKDKPGQGNKGENESDKSLIMNLLKCCPSMLLRLLKAKHRCRKEKRDLEPKDLFKLKGFMVAGTDNHCYKDDLEKLWGIRPMELFAGTEPSIIGTETWTRDGMYFFPDTCFYEFIPESEMFKSLEDNYYIPKTYLMNEVIPDQNYELVISVLKGGAFVRYRVGDVYRCIGLENSEDGTKIPRFRYIDRIPNIIDIGGFTRISENSIRSVVELSRLNIKDWTAKKEYTKDNRPRLHMYVEMDRTSIVNQAISKEILKDHLSIYFKYVDHDYKDLKVILGMDPLEITILKCGTFEEYERQTGKKLRKINPSLYEIMELLTIQNQNYYVNRGRSVSYG